MLVGTAGEKPDNQAVQHVHIGQDAVKAGKFGRRFILDFPIPVIVRADADNPLRRDNAAQGAQQRNGTLSRLNPFVTP